MPLALNVGAAGVSGAHPPAEPLHPVLIPKVAENPGVMLNWELQGCHLKHGLACENIRFSLLFVAGDVWRGGMSTTQRQKFHTDDTNQCLHNKSGSHGVPSINLSNFMCPLVDFGKVLCSSAKELQQNSNTSSREDYIPQILTVLSKIQDSHLHLTSVAFCRSRLSFVNNS